MKIYNNLLRIYKNLKGSLTFRIILIIVVIFSLSSFAWNYFLIKTTYKIVDSIEIIEMNSDCTSVDCAQGPIISEADLPDIEDGFQPMTTIEDQIFLDIQNQLEEDLYKSLFTDYLLLPIVVGTFIGIIVSRLVSKPLTQLNNGINKLEVSKNGYKVDRTGVDIVDKSVTALNQLSDSLHKVEELRDNLIADTSHELRTPVAAIYIQLQGLKDGLLELDEKNITSILKDLERLSALIERMEEYTQYKGSIILRVKKIDFASVIKEVEMILEDKLKSSKLKLVSDVTNNSYIEADKSLLMQLLINIIENATKYSKASKLHIAYSNNEITIEDNGVGINNKDLPYIFERFYRVEKSRNRIHGGMGLGLAIVEEVVTKHGWTIEAFTPEAGGLGFKINS